MYGEYKFNICKIPGIQEKLYIDAKIRDNHLLIGLNHWLTIILQNVGALKFVYYSQNFRVDIQLVLNPRNFINVKFDSSHIFTSKGVVFRTKISFLRIFASIHSTPSLYNTP